MGGCSGSGPCYGCSYSYSCGVAGEEEAIALARTDVSWLDSAADRGASRYAVGRYTVGRHAVGRHAVRREHMDAKGASSRKVRLPDVSN